MTPLFIPLFKSGNRGEAPLPLPPATDGCQRHQSVRTALGPSRWRGAISGECFILQSWGSSSCVPVLGLMPGTHAAFCLVLIHKWSQMCYHLFHGPILSWGRSYLHTKEHIFPSEAPLVSFIWPTPACFHSCKVLHIAISEQRVLQYDRQA